jgi:hypothetical protein
MMNYKNLIFTNISQSPPHPPTLRDQIATLPDIQAPPPAQTVWQRIKANSVVNFFLVEHKKKSIAVVVGAVALVSWIAWPKGIRTVPEGARDPDPADGDRADAQPDLVPAPAANTAFGVGRRRGPARRPSALTAAPPEACPPLPDLSAVLRTTPEQIAEEFCNYERKVADAQIRFIPQDDRIRGIVLPRLQEYFANPENIQIQYMHNGDVAHFRAATRIGMQALPENYLMHMRQFLETHARRAHFVPLFRDYFENPANAEHIQALDAAHFYRIALGCSNPLKDEISSDIKNFLAVHARPTGPFDKWRRVQQQMFLRRILIEKAEQFADEFCRNSEIVTQRDVGREHFFQRVKEYFKNPENTVHIMTINVPHFCYKVLPPGYVAPEKSYELDFLKRVCGKAWRTAEKRAKVGNVPLMGTELDRQFPRHDEPPSVTPPEIQALYDRIGKEQEEFYRLQKTNLKKSILCHAINQIIEGMRQRGEPVWPALLITSEKNLVDSVITVLSTPEGERAWQEQERNRDKPPAIFKLLAADKKCPRLLTKEQLRIFCNEVQKIQNFDVGGRPPARG